MTESYYDRLGVSSDADQETIKSAWQRAVKEKHPDTNDDPNAQQQFIQLKEAYDVLSDPEERERYDRLGHEEYVGDRHHGSSEDTEDAYERDRTESADDGSVDWQANTRGHDAADYVWQAGSGPTASTPPPATTADASVSRRVAAYGACVAVPATLSVYVTAAWTSGIPEYGIKAGLSAGTVGLTAISAVILWLTVVGAEWLLDTDRRLWTPT